MEQVIALLTQWLYFLPAEDSEGEVVTPTAINNYVRLKIMPAPNKKKYSRIHMAYLVMICTLKQSVSIAHVQKMIPMGLTEDEVKAVYSDYAEKHREATLCFIDQVRAQSKAILDEENKSENAVENLVTSFAVQAGYAKLMTEKIVKLREADSQAVLNAEVENKNSKENA